MLQKDNRYRILNAFFNDPVPEGSGFQLREISRKVGIATPSVKKYLNDLEKDGLILRVKHRVLGYPIYYANRESKNFRFLKKLNTMMILEESGLLKNIVDTCMPDVIILFGSSSRGEDTKESDIDLFVMSNEEKIDLDKFEKKINRKINILFEKNFNSLSKELKNNIVNGIILEGYLKVF